MDLKTYQKRALETAIFPPEQAIPYCTLGLCGEIAEVIDLYFSHGPTNRDQELAELGDILWYCAVLAHHCGIELQPEYYPPLSVSIMAGAAKHAGMIANKAKKVIRDGKPLDPHFVAEHITGILIIVSSAANIANSSLEEVAALNIAKLADRAARNAIGGSGDKR